jgi:hypothetical protein
MQFAGKPGTRETDLARSARLRWSATCLLTDSGLHDPPIPQGIRCPLYEYMGSESEAYPIPPLARELPPVPSSTSTGRSSPTAGSPISAKQPTARLAGKAGRSFRSRASHRRADRQRATSAVPLDGCQAAPRPFPIRRKLRVLRLCHGPGRCAAPPASGHVVELELGDQAPGSGTVARRVCAIRTGTLTSLCDRSSFGAQRSVLR